MPFRALQDDEAAMDGAGNASDPDHFYSTVSLSRCFRPSSAAAVHLRRL